MIDEGEKYFNDSMESITPDERRQMELLLLLGYAFDMKATGDVWKVHDRTADFNEITRGDIWHCVTVAWAHWRSEAK
jgi:hypothetical protein